MKENPDSVPSLKDHFADDDIVALAEFRHGVHGEAVCRFLERYASRLSGLFLELPVEYQEDIDVLIASDTVSDRLRRMFEGAAREGKPEIATSLPLILRKAHDLGIPVFCFDATKRQRPGLKGAHDGDYFIEGECRDADMAENILSHYRRHRGKYAVLVGAGHLRERTLDGAYASFGTRMRSAQDVPFAAVRLVSAAEPIPPEFAQDTFADTIIG